MLLFLCLFNSQNNSEPYQHHHQFVKNLTFLFLKKRGIVTVMSVIGLERIFPFSNPYQHAHKNECLVYIVFHSICMQVILIKTDLLTTDDYF